MATVGSVRLGALVLVLVTGCGATGCGDTGNYVPTTCPPTPPQPGTACEVALVCSYEGTCGGRDVATCSAGRWSVQRNPRACTCPSEVPARQTPCTIGVDQVCEWPSECGTTITGRCGTDGWAIDDPGCP